MKFQEQQIVWAKHPQHQIEWPAKVTQVLPKKRRQIAFYNSQNHQSDVFVFEENECKPFNECCINSKDSPLLLYEAYKLAKRQDGKLKQAKEVSKNKSLQSNEWNIEQLKKELDKLFLHNPKEAEIQRLINGASRIKLKENELRIYFKERFCQKLAYLVREESPLDQQLKYVLNELRLTIKVMLIEGFKKGEL